MLWRGGPPTALPMHWTRGEWGSGIRNGCQCPGDTLAQRCAPPPPPHCPHPLVPLPTIHPAQPPPPPVF